MPTMNPVENSSQVAEEGYDEVTGTLAVRFKSGGLYHYSGVSADDYADFAGAESKGRALGAIKGKYDAQKVDETEEGAE